VNLFQIIALCVMGLLLALTLIALVRGWATRRESLLWSMVWIAGGAAISWPEMTKDIAKRLGIGRGADLLLYCAVVVMLVGFLMIYARLRRLRSELTLIVRHLAIKDAGTEPSPPETTSTPPGRDKPEGVLDQPLPEP